MVNLFLMISSVYASDVYEICVHEKQVWSEINQEYKTENVRSFYNVPTLQLIIHKNSFEIERVSKNIESTYTKDRMECWREHKNSELCYDDENKLFFWEYFYKSGKVTRDVMTPCVKNGEGTW